MNFDDVTAQLTYFSMGYPVLRLIHINLIFKKGLKHPAVRSLRTPILAVNFFLICCQSKVLLS